MIYICLICQVIKCFSQSRVGGVALFIKNTLNATNILLNSKEIKDVLEGITVEITISEKLEQYYC